MVYVVLVHLILCVKHVLIRPAHVLQFVVISIPKLPQQLVLVIKLPVVHGGSRQSTSKRDELIVI